MQVLHVCSEMFPLLKTGGLADVLGALPAAQIAGGVDTRVLLPAFPDIRRGIPDAKVVTRRETFAGRITLLFGHYNGVGIYLIDAPHLYDRPGSPYHDTNLFAYTDNVLRFALLGWAAARLALGADLAVPGALLALLIERHGAQGVHDGAYLGWWNLATKLNLALAAGLTLPLLQWLGYQPGSQDPLALQRLAWIYALLPCALKLMAAYLLYRLLIAFPHRTQGVTP